MKLKKAFISGLRLVGNTEFFLMALHEKCPDATFFWSVFSLLWQILRSFPVKSTCLLQKKKYRKQPTFLMYEIKKGLYQWVEISGKHRVLSNGPAWKVSRCNVFLVRVFPLSIWMRRFAEKISIFWTRKNSVFGDFCCILDIRIFSWSNVTPKQYHERIINFLGNDFPKKAKSSKAFNTVLL